MSIFTEVKSAVSTRDAAIFYGTKVLRNGKCCCPFHPDKHPSMKVDNRFHCFGCGADGDVINFVERMYGLAPIDAARKLVTDFGLNIIISPGAYYKSKSAQPTPEQIQKQKDLEQLRAFQLYKRDALIFLHEYYYLLHCAKRDLAPTSPEELNFCHPHFYEAIQNIDLIDWLIEEIENTTITEQIYILTKYKGVIENAKNRISNWNTDTRD